MVLKKTIILLLVLLTSGCAGAVGPSAGSVDAQKVLTFAAIYRESKASRPEAQPSCPSVTLAPDAGYDAPYFPVHVPGRVAKVWIPAHVADHDKDILVAGHWTFMMIEPPHWYIEDHGMARQSP